MTITVKFKTDEVRWSPYITYNMDSDDSGPITFNYSGELGADTLSSASVTYENITAAAPSISGNTVSSVLSGAQEGTMAKMEMKVTTASGSVLSNTVRFNVTNNYENL